jgi:hypothetical protein
MTSGTSCHNVAVRQIRASSTGSRAPHSKSAASTMPTLESDELTVLTAWAEGVADAAAYAPERIDLLLAAASAGATWRAELGLPEPSPRLADAIESLGRVVRTAPPPAGTAQFDALLTAADEEHPGDASSTRWSGPPCSRSAAEILSILAHEPSPERTPSACPSTPVWGRPESRRRLGRLGTSNRQASTLAIAKPCIIAYTIAARRLSKSRPQRWHGAKCLAHRFSVSPRQICDLCPVGSALDRPRGMTATRSSRQLHRSKRGHQGSQTRLREVVPPVR